MLPLRKTRRSLAKTGSPNQLSAILQRPHLLFVACTFIAAILAAGCGPTSDQSTSGTLASEGSTQIDPSVAPPATTGAPQDDAIRKVVDEYIRERTAEGSPYYIDSSPAEFAGFEDEIKRERDHAICLAKFISERDVYHLQFVLSMEMGRYVISQVVLERLNDKPVRRKLYDREELVL